MIETLGPNRQAAICRELSKRFEEILRGTLADLSESLAGRDLKGEIVVVVDRADPVPASAQTVEDALREALKTQSSKDAAAQVAQAFGLTRRDLYQLALSLGQRP